MSRLILSFPYTHPSSFLYFPSFLIYSPSSFPYFPPFFSAHYLLILPTLAPSFPFSPLLFSLYFPLSCPNSSISFLFTLLSVSAPFHAPPLACIIFLKPFSKSPPALQFPPLEFPLPRSQGVVSIQILYTAFSTQHSVHSIQYTAFSTQHSVHNIQYTAFSTHHSVHSI